MTKTIAAPMRDVSRNDPLGPQDRACVVCGRMFISWRASYCSGACRMKALRRRRFYAEHPELLQQRVTSSVAQPDWPMVYECPDCKQRMLGDHRCPRCNHYGRRVGPGGTCPHCDHVFALVDLLVKVSAE